MAYMTLKALKAEIAETERAAEHFSGMGVTASSTQERLHYAQLSREHARHVGHLRRLVEIREEAKLARQDKLIFGHPG